MADIAAPDWNALLAGASAAQGTTDSSNPFYSAVGGSANDVPAPDASTDNFTPEDPKQADVPAPDADVPAPSAPAPQASPQAAPSAAPIAPTLDDMKAAADAIPDKGDGTSATLEHKAEPTLDDMKAAADDMSKPDASSDYPMPKDREFANDALAHHIYQYDAGQTEGINPVAVKGGAMVNLPPTLSQRADAEGISTNGASTSAQLNAEFTLGSLDPTNPDDTEYAKDAVAKAVEKDTGVPFSPDRVRVGPVTHQMEWMPANSKQWDLFSGTGVGNALSHVAAAFPDVVNSGTEALGGMLGVGAGSLSPIAPGYTQVAGGVAGTALGRSFATWTALHSAKERGLNSMDDDEIFRRSIAAGVKSAKTAAVGGFLYGSMRRIALGLSGYDAQLAKNVGSWDAIKAGVMHAAGIQEKVREIPGAEAANFPVTTGQAAGTREAITPETTFSHVRRDQPSQGDASRAAEEALMGSHEDLRGPIADIHAQQRESMGIVQRNLFRANDPEAVSRGGDAMKAAMKVEQDKATQGLAQSQASNAAAHANALDSEVSGVRSNITSQASETTRSALAARQLLQQARSEEFEPFRKEYDNIQRNAGFKLNMTGFREAASNIRGAMTVPGMTAVGVRGQAGQALRQAEQFGNAPEMVKYFKDHLNDPEWGDVAEELQSLYEGEPQSLADVMKLRSGLKAAARDAGNTPGRGREAVVFGKLSNALDQTLNENVDPDVMDAINQTDQSYAATVTKYDYGIVGSLIKDDGRGTFDLADNSAVDKILGGATTTDQFVDAIFSPSSYDAATNSFAQNIIPHGGQILANVQKAVMGRISTRFVNQQTGVIKSPTAFQNWLDEHTAVLDKLFNLTPSQRAAAPEAVAFSPNRLQDVAALARASKSTGDAMKATAQTIIDKYGVYEGSPSHLIDMAVSNKHLEELGSIRAIIRQHQGDTGVAAFDTALGAKAREMMSGSDNRVTGDLVDKFLTSDQGRTIGNIMGKKWTDGVKLVGDMVRIMDMRASQGASSELSEKINQEHRELRNAWRGVRILVPPLSEHSRMLTAALGYMNDKAKIRISNMLANPDQLEELKKFAADTRDPFSAGVRQQLGKIGFQDVNEFNDQQRRLGRMQPE